jgi:redox-sensitive bicupin YhaK (pirin superfamily)
MIDLLIDQRRRDLGGGLEVGRVLPYVRQRMVGPFIFFDHLGPTTFPAGIPRTLDVRPHPHIGLATVTYLFEGEIMHRDSLASEVAIRPGEVNWMVAGRGVTHSERFEQARAVGGPMHGIQSWVALPTEQEESDPTFAHHEAADLPCFEEGGGRARLIAGEAFGMRSPVKAHSPMFYLHWVLPQGAAASLPTSYPERAAYVVSGTVQADGQSIGAGQMGIFGAGREVIVTATTPAVVMLLGGEPLGERFIEWNFVSASRDRIEQAKSDWRAGKMKLPDHDNQEHIPLPPDPPSSSHP